MGDGATLFAQPPGPQGVYYSNPNLLINGDFRINQRVQVSNVALAAGAYGHDRWKAGAGGCTYTFTQLKSSTLITITAGSLIQVVEDANVPAGGVFCFSWVGTAQCRVGVNSNTPSGAYASSPILISGQTAGTTMSVEAGPGTFGFAKLETGLVPTVFVMSDRTGEMLRCVPYYRKTYDYGTALATATLTGALTDRLQGSDTFAYAGKTEFNPEMRGTPNIRTWSPNSGATGKGYNNVGGDFAVLAANTSRKRVFFNANNVAQTAPTSNYVHADFEAEL